MSADLKSADIAIVGGGIVGCAIALAVRRRQPPLPPDLIGAAALTESDVSNWSDFRHRLIEVTAARGEHGEEIDYDERWFQAVERLALENGLVTPAELDARTAALTSDEHDQHDAH